MQTFREDRYLINSDNILLRLLAKLALHLALEAQQSHILSRPPEPAVMYLSHRLTVLSTCCSEMRNLKDKKNIMQGLLLEGEFRLVICS